MVHTQLGSSSQLKPLHAMHDDGDAHIALIIILAILVLLVLRDYLSITLLCIVYFFYHSSIDIVITWLYSYWYYDTGN